MAAIQEHLLRYRSDPVAAIREVDFETITAEAREAETVSVGSASENQDD